MSITDFEPQRYHWFAQALHWLIAALIVGQYVLANLAEAADESGAVVLELGLLAYHKSFGMTILMLAIVRLLWRFISPPPALPESMSAWQANASKVAHWGLYALIFALPLSGWLYSSASAYSVSWFNLVQLPDLVDADKFLENVLHEVHEWLTRVLLAVAALHVAAAIKHLVWDRDGVVGRMLGPVGLIVFVATLATSFWIMSGEMNLMLAGSRVTDTEIETAAKLDSTPRKSAPAKTSSVPGWDIDFEQSSIRFQAVQAGATFTGSWERWQADVRFSPEDLSNSTALVEITTDSAHTRDEERDDTLAAADWFDAARFPAARFRASEFVTVAPGEYRANGHLAIKDSEFPVTFDFALTRTPTETPSQSESTGAIHYRLEGGARLDRLRLGLGTGEWEDTAWIGQHVDVNVIVVATVPNPQ